MATPKETRRKSSMFDFDSIEEYEKFAAKRNEATKRCRQKKDDELKVQFKIIFSTPNFFPGHANFLSELSNRTAQA